jgi:hypothetical protein
MSSTPGSTPGAALTPTDILFGNALTLVAALLFFTSIPAMSSINVTIAEWSRLPFPSPSPNLILICSSVAGSFGPA